MRCNHFKDENQLGIKKGDVAELTIKKDAIILTLNSDFLILKKEFQKKSRIIYIKIHPRNPKKIAGLIKNNLINAVECLKYPGKIIISEYDLEFLTP
ncbi:MAG: DUF5615 family PIN-like protein [Promethearchaeota archaeon]